MATRKGARKHQSVVSVTNREFRFSSKYFSWHAFKHLVPESSAIGLSLYFCFQEDTLSIFFVKTHSRCLGQVGRFWLEENHYTITLTCIIPLFPLPSILLPHYFFYLWVYFIAGYFIGIHSSFEYNRWKFYAFLHSFFCLSTIFLYPFFLSNFPSLLCIFVRNIASLSKDCRQMEPAVEVPVGTLKMMFRKSCSIPLSFQSKSHQVLVSLLFTFPLYSFIYLASRIFCIYFSSGGTG